jgi:hypothetical protein
MSKTASAIACDLSGVRSITSSEINKTYLKVLRQPDNACLWHRTWIYFQVIWVCILCRKKQELLIKTGTWMHRSTDLGDDPIMRRIEQVTESYCRFLNKFHNLNFASSKLEVNKFIPINFATGKFSTWNRFKNRPLDVSLVVCVTNKNYAHT